MHWLAEITYPIIDPVLFEIGDIKVRWYGLTYVLAFILAWWVLTMLAKRRRFPVAAEKVADVLFWGILGVFLGGRIGYLLFYAMPMGDFEWSSAYKVWEGGMSFHGGLLGVIIAYWIWSWKTDTPRGQLFDGLTLATPLGIFCVRMANFCNAELFGRPWDGPWAMRFPLYNTAGGYENWEKLSEAQKESPRFLTDLRHPSQLYEAFAEGILLFFILRWLMLKKGVGGGRIAGWFLILYGTFRFFIEFAREPDQGLGLFVLDLFTQGQQLCFGMILAGSIVLWICKKRGIPNLPTEEELQERERRDAPEVVG